MNYEIFLSNPNGQRLVALTELSRLTYQRIVNNYGACSLVLPSSLDDALLKVDNRIEIWRAPEGKSHSLQFAGFVRRFGPQDDADGLTSSNLYAYDLNWLLDKAIVAYAAGSAQADRSGLADNVIKAIVRDNLGASAIAARNLTAAGFSVQADVGLGPTITKGMAWRNVLLVLQEIANDAAKQGTPVYFDIVWTSATTLEFRTFINQRGNDHSLTSTQPVVIAGEFGTMAMPALDNDYSQERNYIYAGGQGEGAARVIVEVSDAARIGLSPWNRREAFVDARDATTTPGVTSRANEALQDGRPRRRFSGNIIDAPGARYGIEWDFGDKVVAAYRGRQYSALVNALTITVDQKGNEKIDGRLEVTGYD